MRKTKHTYSAAREWNRWECLMRQNTQTDAYTMREPPVQNSAKCSHWILYNQQPTILNCAKRKNQQTNKCHQQQRQMLSSNFRKGIQDTLHSLSGQIFQCVCECECVRESLLCNLHIVFVLFSCCWTFWFDLLTFGLQMRFTIVWIYSKQRTTKCYDNDGNAEDEFHMVNG